jgi:hypothetical protein
VTSAAGSPRDAARGAHERRAALKQGKPGRHELLCFVLIDAAVAGGQGEGEER